jgi:hypothetical protein
MAEDLGVRPSVLMQGSTFDLVFDHTVWLKAKLHRIEMEDKEKQDRELQQSEAEKVKSRLGTALSRMPKDSPARAKLEEILRARGG